MRAIIIAAGQGRRLRPYTDDRPKCMVEVAGRPLLHHQLNALNRYRVDDVVVIRGYLGDRIDPDGVRFVDNALYAEHNILMSLFSAGPELVGDVIVSYGDIVYHPDALGALLDTPGPGALVVDRRWKDAYLGRTDHPISEAELCRVSHGGRITAVGKKVGPGGAFGEFIGLARFNAALLARLWAWYLRAAVNEEKPIGHAANLREAYLTDVLNVAIECGEHFSPAPIEGGWREIDTVQDLHRAEEVVRW